MGTAKQQADKYCRELCKATCHRYSRNKECINHSPSECFSTAHRIYVNGYNQAIDDVDNLIDKHEEEVYIGVVEDILKLKDNQIR